MKPFRKNSILAKIYEEQYCCLKGYLGLCAARGETAQGMAKNLSVSPDTIWYHMRKDAAGRVPCLRRSDCLAPVIEEISGNPTTPRQAETDPGDTPPDDAPGRDVQHPRVPGEDNPT